MSGRRTTSPGSFAAWRRGRPFVGSLLIAIAGIEMFLSTQLDIGKLHIQLGIEGFQATVIPVGFLLLAALIVAMPQHRVFYGVIALALSLYSIVGVNLGGFLIGMLLSAVGGVLAVSWAPRVTALEAVMVEPLGTTATEPAEEPELVAATPASDRGLHAEFAPYSTLVAIAEATRSTHVAA
jgi:hypothetical protein